MSNILLKTPLYEEHIKLNARMVPFAGYSMPVQYTALIEEHEAVRNSAGLFDVSHMGQIEISGYRSLEAVELISTNDVSTMKDGQCRYSILCNPEGGTIDDIIIYKYSNDKYMLCVNGANVEKAFAWAMKMCAAISTVKNLSPSYAQVALQGPKAAEILKPLCEGDVTKLKFYWFMETSVDNVKCLVSRTGYTGEDGFEIYMPPDKAPQLWNALLKASKGHGLLPCGLGARDTLRLESAYPLYGHELDEVTSPLDAGLQKFVVLEKGSFVGRDTLAAEMEKGLNKVLVGIEMIENSIPREGYKVFKDSKAVGKITSGTFSPTLKKPIALAYVPPALKEIGSELEIEVRGKLKKARVVKTPFYKRPKS